MFFLFLHCAQNNADKNINQDDINYFYYGKVADKSVFITQIEGPIDKENLENIINLNTWDDKNINKILFNFRRIGINAKISVRNDKIYIELKGPKIVLLKKKTKSPLGVGDTFHKKCMKSPAYWNLANDFDNFQHKIEEFIISYYLSTGKEIKILPPKMKKKSDILYNTQIRFEENNSSIVSVCEYFVDDINSGYKVLWEVFQQINKQNIIKEENIFLKILGWAFGDSAHYLQNVGKKDKESIICLLRHLGYVNAKFISKTMINIIGPDKKPIKTSVVYSLFLGKKSKLHKIILISNSIPVTLQTKVLNRLKNVFFNNDFVFKNINDIDQILLPLNVKCIKTSIVKVSDEEFDIQVFCDLNESIKCFQNIEFKNFPCKSSNLYTFASAYGISTGTPFNQDDINNFIKALETIAGRQIKFNQKTDRGIVATFTADNKPLKYAFVDNFLSLDSLTFLSISIIKFQFFFLFGKLCRIVLTPEGLFPFVFSMDCLKRFKIAPKVEFDYYTTKNIKFNLVFRWMFEVKKAAFALFTPVDSIQDIELKGSVKYSDSELFVNISKPEMKLAAIYNKLVTRAPLYSTQPYLKKSMSFEYQNNFENLAYILTLGYEYNHDLDSSNDYLKNITLSIKTYHPLKIRYSIYEEHGVNLSGEFSTSTSFLGNVLLYKFIGAFALKKSRESVIQSYGAYRVPGISSNHIGDLFLLGRFLLTSELWDSSEVIAKMFTLMIGVIIQGGIINRYKNYDEFKKSCTCIKIIGNAGIIFILDLMGMMSIFISVTIDYRGRPKFDFGVMFKSNPFAIEQTYAQLS